jgi:peroxiredoxin Q/BCP
MKNSVLMGIAVAMALVAIASTPAGAAGLEVGDTAPGFKLMGSDGKEYTLDQFRGEKVVVVAWFPKAFTGG